MFGQSAINNDYDDTLTSQDDYDFEDDDHDYNNEEEFMDDFLMNPKQFSIKETALWQRITSELRTRKEKMIERRKKLEYEIKTPTFIRTKDKYAFTIGVIITVSTTAIAARYPYLLPPFYLFWSVILLGARFFMYHQQHCMFSLFIVCFSLPCCINHYFMLDFCYFSNLLLLFYLFMYPTSPHLYLLNFANANGPLLWAIVTWRNSLVFHDLDKVTSVFIHAFPPIVTFAIRQFPESSQYVAFQTCVNNKSDCTVSFGQMVIPHLTFFAFWQICYYLKTEIIDRERMKRDTHIITSFRWMKQYKRSPAYKIINKYEEQYQVFIFMALQFTYHLLTVLPVKLMYDYPKIHALVMCYIFVQCVHNGSNFYIEKFSSSYLKRLQEIASTLENSQLAKGSSAGAEDGNDSVLPQLKKQEQQQQHDEMRNNNESDTE